MGNQRNQLAEPANLINNSALGREAGSEKKSIRLVDTAVLSPSLNDGSWPGIPPTLRNLLVLQRAVGNKAVSHLLEANVKRQAENGKPLENTGVDLAPSGQRSLESEFEDTTDENKPNIQTEPLSAGSQSKQVIKEKGIVSGSDAWGGRSMNDSDSIRGSLWAAATASRAILGPQAISWAAIQGSNETTEAFRAIAGPSTKTLADIEAADAAGTVGLTTIPTGFKAPDFNFNTSKKKVGKTDKWFAQPKLTAKAFEGNSTCWFIAPGLHKTGFVPTGAPAGLPVFLRMSKAMSKRDHDAELEHSRDLKRAFKISLKEAHTVLKKHVVGKTFGPLATEADVKTKVLDRIKNKLIHPQLGNDKTKWAAKYMDLCQLSGVRDIMGWHTFLPGKITVTKTKIIVQVAKGTTKINVVKTNALIKY